MSTPLLTLGTFSFEGLEAPDRIQLKTKQRLAIHPVCSGSSIIDYLGEDCEIISFRGIFSGTNAAGRIQSIDYLRNLGVPLNLSWNSRTLPVLIHEFQLDYSSDRWIPYRLSCYVVPSSAPSAMGSDGIISVSPITEVGDALSLLQVAGLGLTSGQTDALVALAALDFDTPPADAMAQTTSLALQIDAQLAALTTATQNSAFAAAQTTPAEAADDLAAYIENFGQQAALILGGNRVNSILLQAQGINQQ